MHLGLKLLMNCSCQSGVIIPVQQQSQQRVPRMATACAVLTLPPGHGGELPVHSNLCFILFKNKDILLLLVERIHLGCCSRPTLTSKPSPFLPALARRSLPLVEQRGGCGNAAEQGSSPSKEP